MRSTSTTCPERRPHRNAGFTLVSMVFVLVVLALLGSALAGVSMRQQLGSAAELDHARALQAARAGLEWAAFQVLGGASAPACFTGTSFTPGGLEGFTVSVSCTRSDGNDGDSALAFYTLVANACNRPGAGGCPSADAAPQPTYVERQLTWTVAR